MKSLSFLIDLKTVEIHKLKILFKKASINVDNIIYYGNILKIYYDEHYYYDTDITTIINEFKDCIKT